MELMTTKTIIEKDGSVIEIIGKGKDLGKSFEMFKNGMFPYLAGCDNLDNNLCRAEEIKLLNQE